MMTQYRLLIAAALVLLIQHNSQAGLGFHTSCSDRCTESCQMMCVPECKVEKVEKHCWQTECDTVTVPPVTLPCCKCLLHGRKKCCCNRGCSDGSCTGCCESSKNNCCKNSLLRKVFGKFACCDVKCVTKLKPHKYECEECVVDWKLVSAGSCGCCSSCGDTSLCPPSCGAPEIEYREGSLCPPPSIME
ncbi:MAG: hypothetical protein KDA81_04415 [Planctomycetaceae bacterium]|nr:hypothetical protein [Planctomycetaceae bacterium]